MNIRRFFSGAALFVSAISFFSQTALAQETVATGAGYANEIFYDIATKSVKATAPLNEWDIALEVSGFSGAVLINGAMGVQLWNTAFTGEDGFAKTIDTASLFKTTPWNNSTATWHVGAFNMDRDYNNGDFGWGEYNTTTHQITGTTVYVMKLPNKQVKKIYFDGLSAGAYNFRYANIDGSGLVNATITKANYAKKNFAYYSLQTGKEFNREPETSTWNLTFGKYIAMVSQGGAPVPYPVMGVRTNNGVKVAKYKGANPSSATSTGLTFGDTITTIGHDWKNFNGTSYDVAADVAYFIQLSNGNIYRVVFTGFGGSATGSSTFRVDQTVTAVGENTDGTHNALSVFPNPAIGGKATILCSSAQKGSVSIYDGLGRLVRSFENGAQELSAFDVDGLQSGVYLAVFSNGNHTLMTRQFIVNR